MPTRIYQSTTVSLVDGTELYVTPLKIKHLRAFMEAFDQIKTAKNEDETISYLLECTRLAMKQYCPSLKTVDDVADNLDMATMYKIIDVAAGVSVKEDGEEDSKSSSDSNDAVTWDSLDLAKLESEVFLLGIWKDYEELETSLSMPELTATLEIKRELAYQDKKFSAAMQGVDLDEQSGKKQQNKWEEMKARVFSGGKTSDSGDVLALQGVNAQKAGFGIGMGLSYEKIS
jgi:hypothetical protein